MGQFIGRHTELARLTEITALPRASFIVVRGRRRVGKSRLIEQFSKQFEHYYVFTGLAPDKNTTPEHQLREFSRQMAEQFKAPRAIYEDWGDAFSAVAAYVQSGKVLLFFDEISWMGSRDPTFLAKIKDVWDRKLKNNQHLVFVVCSSASSWIEEKLLKGPAFVGRITQTLTLEPLPMPDCDPFWPENSITPYEKLKVLSVTGGIPKYLEDMNPQQPAENNIRRLCFTPGGSLVNEFNLIFTDIFLRNSEEYRLIATALASGPKEMEKIQELLQRRTAGSLPAYLRELELTGFVSRDYNWSVRTGETGKLSRFRLRDNYLRIYLKYIQGHRGQMERGSYQPQPLGRLPGWAAIMDLQLENLVLNSRRALQEILRIDPQEVLNENPYFQRKTQKSPGCQIDYMIQTRYGSLYVCEIRFSKDPVGASVIEEVRNKIAALKLPKGISIRPVLIHVNGVTSGVVDSRYFAAIVDAGTLLRPAKATGAASAAR